MPREKSETEFKRSQVKPAIEALPRSWWVKISFIPIRGIPDYLGCVNGHFVALELKKVGAKPDPRRERLQEWTCIKIRRAGGFAWSRVDSRNLGSIIESIRLLCY